MARLLGDSDLSAFYYALDVDDIKLGNFLPSLLGTLSRQNVIFGRQMNVLPANVIDDPYKHMDVILRTFIAELSELGDREIWLVLDEFDRADLADDVKRFVERLSHQAPARCKIVLNGRSLPRMPWLSMIANRQAVIIRDGHIVQKNIYGVRNEVDASLKVLSLGPGYVFLDDFLIDNWEGHLPRLLLFFAMDRPEVTRNQICETFWPKLDIDPAVNVFHVTKRRLHKAIGMDVMAHDGRYYRVDRERPFYFDAFEFVEALLEGRHGEPAEPFELWQRVAKLYRGPFLQGHDDGWIVERREAYQNAYIEALENIAAIWEARESFQLALYTLIRALETDYRREEIHLRLLKLYVQLGRRAEAVEHFRNLERWSKTNKIALSGQIRQLFSDITA
ncbi:MAG: bacterial transcriptional activator domain-containing protein [Chloroflexi bacterium]|nr:bacterial transcriptional activator domain-containing protein [Chloroflexota bacterium]